MDKAYSSFIKTVLIRIKRIRHKVYIAYYRKMPIKKNKIIMWANSFRQYGCNPKYITEYLLKYYPNQYDIVWVFEPQVDISKELSEKVRIVRYFSMDYLKELHTAKFIICNMRTGPAHFWFKRKEQIYIQTWHSSIRLKKIEADAASHLSDSYIETLKEDSKKIDVLLSGCDFSSKIFRNSFWYNGTIIKSGTPRCDILVSQNDHIKEKVYRYYNLSPDAKLVLYAPTFRNNKIADVYGMQFEKLIEALNKKEPNKWVVGCRLHPNIIEQYEDDVCISMTNYPDMQELIVASDILITDYSSCMFDMAIAGKPCILFTPDLEMYLMNERGMYFDIHELPFPLATNMDSLINEVYKFDSSEYNNKLRSFMNTIGSYEDGHATERVVKYIKEKSGL